MSFVSLKSALPIYNLNFNSIAISVGILARFPYNLNGKTITVIYCVIYDYYEMGNV